VRGHVKVAVPCADQVVRYQAFGSGLDPHKGCTLGAQIIAEIQFNRFIFNLHVLELLKNVF
jgi:hypothetical protein